MEQIEIEYKILITKDIFDQILNDYHNQIKQDYIQVNDYFTHPILQQKKYMLRIRTKNNQYEMTLKRPMSQHRLETNIILTLQQKNDFYNHLNLQNQITDILIQENIPIEELQQQFSLTTHRYDIPLPEGMLSLDMNTYLHQVDYELEFEVFNEQDGYQKFLDILKPYKLHYTKNCQSKIKRVLDAI